MAEDAVEAASSSVLLSAEEHKARGNSAMGTKDFRAALLEYDKALEASVSSISSGGVNNSCGVHAAARANRVACLLELQRWSEAEAEAGECIARLLRQRGDAISIPTSQGGSGSDGRGSALLGTSSSSSESVAPPATATTATIATATTATATATRSGLVKALVRRAVAREQLGLSEGSKSSNSRRSRIMEGDGEGRGEGISGDSSTHERGSGSDEEDAAAAAAATSMVLYVNLALRDVRAALVLEPANLKVVKVVVDSHRLTSQFTHHRPIQLFVSAPPTFLRVSNSPLCARHFSHFKPTNTFFAHVLIISGLISDYFTTPPGG
jgi:hypothetical protein